MAITTEAFEYSDGSTLLRGQLARDDTWTDPRPGVLIAHTWAGCGPFEQGKAADIAELGYVALAVDMYGGGIVGNSTEENAKLMSVVLEDRALLQRRIRAALDALKALPSVDSERTAAIGYCFGGLCVLDLARTGVSFQAAVSFHGLLNPPGNIEVTDVRPRVLVLHGWDDPMAKPDSVEALAEEFTRAGADWQVHAYGRTMHAFTNPEANNLEMGTVYNAQADRRSWNSMRQFLSDSFDLG